MLVIRVPPHPAVVPTVLAVALVMFVLFSVDSRHRSHPA